MLRCHWKKRNGTPLKTRTTTLNGQEGELSVEDPKTHSASFPPSSVCNHSLSRLAASLAVPLKSNFIVIKITW